MLLFQFFSHHCSKAEASDKNYPGSFDKDKVGDETGINDQISDKDKRLSVIERPKRPYRLLLVKIQ